VLGEKYGNNFQDILDAGNRYVGLLVLLAA
jgi:hypothetical protein